MSPRKERAGKHLRRRCSSGFKFAPPSGWAVWKGSNWAVEERAREQRRWAGNYSLNQLNFITRFTIPGFVTNFRDTYSFVGET